MSFWDSIVNSAMNISTLNFGGLFEQAADDIQAFGEGYTGERIAKKNLEFQKEQFEYQKQLNERQMQREDTSYQRKVADMVAAGFNPILAASGPGEPSSPLRAANAPQLGDYSGGIRQGIGSILSLISMKKDFAMKDAEIALLTANKDKVEAEAAGIKTENDYRDEYLRARNENLDLDNRLKSGTLDYNIRLAQSKLSLSQQEQLVKGFEIILAKDKHALNQIDYEIQVLVKEGKLTENQILGKRLELLTTEVLQKSLDYSNSLWDTDYYHGINLPVGFNSSWIGQLIQFFGNLTWSTKELAANYFSDVTDRNVPVRLKNDVKRPVGSNFLWTKNMDRKRDYGVKRNVY